MPLTITSITQIVHLVEVWLLAYVPLPIYIQHSLDRTRECPPSQRLSRPTVPPVEMYRHTQTLGGPLPEARSHRRAVLLLVS